MKLREGVLSNFNWNCFVSGDKTRRKTRIFEAGGTVHGIEGVNFTVAAISDAKMHNGDSVNDRGRVKDDELWNATNEWSWKADYKFWMWEANDTESVA